MPGNEQIFFRAGYGAVTGVLMMMGPDSLAQLIENHAPALVLYARQWCAAAEDVVQEALIKLATQRTPPERRLSWLYRVVRNKAISTARSESRRRKHEQQAAQIHMAWFQADDRAFIDPAEAGDALSEIAIEQREIIVAHLWGGLTFEQIADVVGCSSSAAHRRYVAGLAALRERLGISCPKEKTKNSMRSKPH